MPRSPHSGAATLISIEYEVRWTFREAKYFSTLSGIEPRVAHPEGQSLGRRKSQNLIRKLRSRALIWKPQNKLGNREIGVQNSTWGTVYRNTKVI